MAKNRNQNRQREQRQDQRRNSGMEPREQDSGPMREEEMMPSTTQPARRSQKRFGHN